MENRQYFSVLLVLRIGRTFSRDCDAWANTLVLLNILLVIEYFYYDVQMCSIFTAPFRITKISISLIFFALLIQNGLYQNYIFAKTDFETTKH